MLIQKGLPYLKKKSLKVAQLYLYLSDMRAKYEYSGNKPN